MRLQTVPDDQAPAAAGQAQVQPEAGPESAVETEADAPDGQPVAAVEVPAAGGLVDEALSGPFAAGAAGGALILFSALLVFLIIRIFRGAHMAQPKFSEDAIRREIEAAARRIAGDDVARLERRVSHLEALLDEARRDQNRLQALVENGGSARRATRPEGRPHERADTSRPSPGYDAASPLPPAAAGETGLVAIREAVGDIGAKGSSLLHDPLALSRFVREHDIRFLRLEKDGELTEVDRKEAPRTDLWFFAVEDRQSGVHGVFFGPQMRNIAERVAASPQTYRARLEPWFQLERSGRKAQLASPALIYLDETSGRARLADRGRITI